MITAHVDTETFADFVDLQGTLAAGGIRGKTYPSKQSYIPNETGFEMFHYY